MAEYSAIYEDAIDRIQASYASCSAAEQKILLQILQEMAKTGYSYTLEQVWLSDFREIPVSIDQFLDDPYYLGGTNDYGNNVYPFWRQTFKDIFSAGNKYNEIIFSGATRIGKTSSAITVMAYMLYRLMLYRDPHKYFQKKAISKFTLGFANLTKELALGVGYREFNDTLKEVPWFMDHGSVTRSDRNFFYLPEGDKIEIIAASDSAQLLGKQMWACLVGDTKILTCNGIKTISECAETTQTIFQFIDDRFVATDAEVVLTKYCSTTIRIELEDGSVIEGSPDHKVMLSDGSYKELQDITSSDDLLTFNIREEVDEMNLENIRDNFTVYEHVSPEGKRYIGITSRSVNERWLTGGKGYCNNAHFWSAILKYGWDNFQHNILAEGLTLDEACQLEIDLISRYETTDPNKGYNYLSGGNWHTFDEDGRKNLESAAKKRSSDLEFRKRLSESLKGHVVSEETRKKISKSLTGRKMSADFCKKQRARKHSPETISKLRGHTGWSKGLTKDNDSRVKKISESLKGKERSKEWCKNLSTVKKLKYANGYSPRWVNNGEIETFIQDGEKIPEGFTAGRLSNLDTYIHRGQESKKISSSELDNYLKEGWVLGRPESVGEAISAARQRMHWEYEGIRFETARELAEYLNKNGYPDIVDSTITSLCKKGFSKSIKYRSLDGKVLRIDHESKIDINN